MNFVQQVKCSSQEFRRKGCWGKTPFLGSIFTEPSIFMLNITPECQRSFYSFSQSRIFVIGIPRSVTRIKPNQAEDALHDTSIVWFIYIRCPPYADIDKTLVLSSVQYVVRHLRKVFEVVGHIPLFWIK